MPNSDLTKKIKESFDPMMTQVLIKPEAIIKKTPSGIIIPTTERPQTGIVVAVGPEVETIKVGDRVSFGRNDGTEIYVNKVTYLMLTEESIYCLIEEKN